MITVWNEYGRIKAKARCAELVQAILTIVACIQKATAATDRVAFEAALVRAWFVASVLDLYQVPAGKLRDTIQAVCDGREPMDNLATELHYCGSLWREPGLPKVWAYLAAGVEKEAERINSL